MSTKKGSNKGSNKGSKKGNVPPVVTQGNIPLTQRMNAKELQSSIDGLMDDLRNASTRQEKKRLRRMLRTRGHFGGLGIVSARMDARNAS